MPTVRRPAIRRSDSIPEFSSGNEAPEIVHAHGHIGSTCSRPLHPRLILGIAHHDVQAIALTASSHDLELLFRDFRAIPDGNNTLP